MNNYSDLFQQMCNEAMNDLASGDKGWKEANTNTLFLACFGMIANHMAHMVVKPLWTMVVIIATCVIGYFINLIFGG